MNGYFDTTVQLCDMVRYLRVTEVKGHLVAVLTRRTPSATMGPPNHTPCAGVAIVIQVGSRASWEGAAPLGIPQLQGASRERPA